MLKWFRSLFEKENCLLLWKVEHKPLAYAWIQVCLRLSVNVSFPLELNELILSYLPRCEICLAFCGAIPSLMIISCCEHRKEFFRVCSYVCQIIHRERCAMCRMIPIKQQGEPEYMDCVFVRGILYHLRVNRSGLPQA